MARPIALSGVEAIERGCATDQYDNDDDRRDDVCLVTHMKTLDDPLAAYGGLSFSGAIEFHELWMTTPTSFGEPYHSIAVEQFGPVTVHHRNAAIGITVTVRSIDRLHPAESRCPARPNAKFVIG